jgi:hypothetical protein
MFDPFGINLEHYDELGRYRATHLEGGKAVPIDASWDVDLADVSGRITDGLDLSTRLGTSRALRECFARQISMYALARGLGVHERCATAGPAQAFEASAGGMRELIKAVALWPGLRDRKP